MSITLWEIYVHSFTYIQNYNVRCSINSCFFFLFTDSAICASGSFPPSKESAWRVLEDLQQPVHWSPGCVGGRLPQDCQHGTQCIQSRWAGHLALNIPQWRVFVVVNQIVIFPCQCGEQLLVFVTLCLPTHYRKYRAVTKGPSLPVHHPPPCCL